MPLVAEVIDAVIGGDTHRDTHALEMTAPTGATIATIAIDNDQAASLTRWPGSPNTHQALGWWSDSKEPAATASDSPERSRPPA